MYEGLRCAPPTRTAPPSRPATVRRPPTGPHAPAATKATVENRAFAVCRTRVKVRALDNDKVHDSSHAFDSAQSRKPVRVNAPSVRAPVGAAEHAYAEPYAVSDVDSSVIAPQIPSPNSSIAGPVTRSSSDSGFVSPSHSGAHAWVYGAEDEEADVQHAPASSRIESDFAKVLSTAVATAVGFSSVKNAFRQFDLNGDGFVTLRDMASFDWCLPYIDLAHLFCLVDFRRTGAFNLDQFATFITLVTRRRSEKFIPVELTVDMLPPGMRAIFVAGRCTPEEFSKAVRLFSSTPEDLEFLERQEERSAARARARATRKVTPEWTGISTFKPLPPKSAPSVKKAHSVLLAPKIKSVPFTPKIKCVPFAPKFEPAVHSTLKLEAIQKFSHAHSAPKPAPRDGATAKPPRPSLMAKRTSAPRACPTAWPTPASTAPPPSRSLPLPSEAMFFRPISPDNASKARRSLFATAV
jgi:hypothetical protein